MALFCDFENVALGVRDAKYEKFDIVPVLERLLLKGSIVVKKAYCDWDRYKGFKASMHEASFELIEIPHVRQSGKNSADIRLVVDALDLCYTKSHVDTFVIISGDSDFSPLVSKLRENAKKVIGVGVKNSTSDLLVANCDEFIFYDDLVREQQRAIAKREASEASARAKRSSDDGRQQKHSMEARKAQAIALAVETFDALSSERGESGKIWASVLKSAIKRRKPDFSESYFGFRAFGNLLDEAQARGLLEVGRDEKSGAFVFRSNAAAVAEPAVSNVEETGVVRNEKGEKNGGRRKGRGGRKETPVPVESAAVEPQYAAEEAESFVPQAAPEHDVQIPQEAADEPAEVSERAEAQQPSRPAARRGRKTATKKRGAQTSPESAQPFWPGADADSRPSEEAASGADIAETAASPDPFHDHPDDTPSTEQPKPARKPARKSAPRARRPRKTAAAS
ncbi:NYN domain-containing protein [Caballeronia telluris]|nr:NYN domain-containing protein [Caballeronia telluris]